jgi:hypothetical protein
MHSSQLLASMLRDTLRRVELSAEINPGDTELTELRHALTRKIAALEGEGNEMGENTRDYPRRV